MARRTTARRRRSRRHRFYVDEKFFGAPVIQTCGATSQQLRDLDALAESPHATRDDITMAVKEMTGYEQWSFLRLEEARELIKRFSDRE